MAPAVYTPAAAASVVGVHPNSIRDWCKQYADQLTAGANPTAGQPRQLTPGDVARLQLVAQWRQEGLQPDAIVERLSQLPAGDPPTPYIVTDAPQIVDRSSTINDASIASHSPASADTAQPLLHDLAVLVDSRHDRTVERLTAIDDRLSAIERRRHGLVMLAAGLVIGVLVTAVAVLLVRLLAG